MKTASKTIEKNTRLSTIPAGSRCAYGSVDLRTTRVVDGVALMTAAGLAHNEFVATYGRAPCSDRTRIFGTCSTFEVGVELCEEPE